MRQSQRGRVRPLVSVVVASAVLSWLLLLHGGAFPSASGSDSAAMRTAQVLSVSLDHGLGAGKTRRSLLQRPSRLLSLYGKWIAAGVSMLALLLLVGVALFETPGRACRNRRLSTPTRGPPALAAL
jgi:hypothetical protein